MYNWKQNCVMGRNVPEKYTYIKYRTDTSMTPPSSKTPPPSFEPISELAMHVSISSSQDLDV